MFSCLFFTPFPLTKWLTQIFVDCNRFNKSEINEGGLLKEYRNKRRKDKTRNKLTDTSLIIPTSIHTNQTKYQNKV